MWRTHRGCASVRASTRSRCNCTLGSEERGTFYSSEEPRNGADSICVSPSRSVGSGWSPDVTLTGQSMVVFTSGQLLIYFTTAYNCCSGLFRPVPAGPRTFRGENSVNDRPSSPLCRELPRLCGDLYTPPSQKLGDLHAVFFVRSRSGCQGG